MAPAAAAGADLCPLDVAVIDALFESGAKSLWFAILFDSESGFAKVEPYLYCSVDAVSVTPDCVAVCDKRQELGTNDCVVASGWSFG